MTLYDEAMEIHDAFMEKQRKYVHVGGQSEGR
jgi:hypothetical protein